MPTCVSSHIYRLYIFKLFNQFNHVQDWIDLFHILKVLLVLYTVADEERCVIKMCAYALQQMNLYIKYLKRMFQA